MFTPTYTGLGERAHQASPAVDLETHIADVLGVIEFEGLTDIALVGHSYGGMVATGVADRVALSRATRSICSATGARQDSSRSVVYPEWRTFSRLTSVDGSEGPLATGRLSVWITLAPSFRPSR